MGGGWGPWGHTQLGSQGPSPSGFVLTGREIQPAWQPQHWVITAPSAPSCSSTPFPSCPLKSPAPPGGGATTPMLLWP